MVIERLGCRIIEFPMTAASQDLLMGVAVRAVMEDGIRKCELPTDDTGVFLGVVKDDVVDTLFKNTVEMCTVETDGTDKYLLLGNMPVTGQIRVDGSRAFVAGTDYNATENVIKFTAAGAADVETGEKVKVTYRYQMTVMQSRVVDYQNYTNERAASYLRQGSIIVEGMIDTDQFDPTADWSAVTAETGVKFTADGVFVPESGATQIDTVDIMSIPTAENPYLGLRIRK